LSWLWASRTRRLVIILLVVVAVLLILDFVGVLTPLIPRYFLLFFGIALLFLTITIADRYDVP
jgi:uncharacterized protein YqgC (DUF456 family)